MTESHQSLTDRLAARDAHLGVIGLGYVGLPLALAFADAGFSVLGFDLDAHKVDTLRRGQSYLRGFPSARVAALVESSRLDATTDSRRLSEPDVLIICVPTPLSVDGSPDLSFVKNTTSNIADRLRKGQLVILESTTYPGTTDEVVRPALEVSGLVCGTDFFLAYSPEREDPGSSTHSLATIPKVVGGVDKTATALAESLYAAIVPRTVPVSSPRVAEASKLTENIFRAVNIALVNELKMVFDRLNLDVWEVLDAASTKPFGFMRFNPGPGWGGHCIPIDPFYLAWKARQAGVDARFIELAGEINVMMPRFVVDKLERALSDRDTRLEGASILLLGLAYKKDVADPRESPAFEIFELLHQKGARPEYHDPLIPVAPRMRRWRNLDASESQELSPESLATYDAVILVTDHSAIDYALVRKHARLIIDTRGVYRDSADHIIPA